MDRYQKVERPKPDVPIKENEIRITSQGLVRNYINYATTLLQELQGKEIVLKAMGQAVSKTVAIAEIIKRRVPSLHQDTSISSISITDVWEPIEEGLLPVEQTRLVSLISITLSAKELNKNSPGYQAPAQEQQKQTKPQNRYQSQQLPPRQARGFHNGDYEDSYGRGQGRGRGRGRNWNRGGFANFEDNGGYSNYGRGGGRGDYGGYSSYGRGGGRGDYGGYASYGRGGGRGDYGGYPSYGRGGGRGDYGGYSSYGRGGGRNDYGGYSNYGRGGGQRDYGGYSNNGRGGGRIDYGGYSNYGRGGGPSDNGGYSNYGRSGGQSGRDYQGGGYGRGRGGGGSRGYGRGGGRSRGADNQS